MQEVVGGVVNGLVAVEIEFVTEGIDVEVDLSELMLSKVTITLTRIDFMT